MPKWLTNLVMLIVLTIWSAFMGLSFVHGIDPPIPYWTIPGATYLLLRSRLTSISFGPFQADTENTSQRSSSDDKEA